MDILNFLDFIILNKKYVVIVENQTKYIEVGATTPLIKFENYVNKYYPDFNSILKRYGSVQIRNVATMAGNIATASPIGDTLPLLLSLDAKLVLKDAKKTKIVPLNGFFLDYRKTKLKKDNLLNQLEFLCFQKISLKLIKFQKDSTMIFRLYVLLSILR